MRVLVTGGAGYIGSHVVRQLLGGGHEVIVLDSLERGRREMVADARLLVGDVTDSATLKRAFADAPDAVIHLAARKSVEESMRRPGEYFRVNTSGTLALAEAAIEAGVRDFVFSSTAAVYAPAEAAKITEDSPVGPQNPYGESKLMAERILDWLSRLAALRFVSLRYFNAAGAHPSSDIGESWQDAANLIPRVLRAAAGAGPAVEVYGTDYPTPDGTPVRDYIHVVDLADAHVLALEHLAVGGESSILNLGSDRGWSVREVIAAAERITGSSVPFIEAPRRPGDMPQIWANSGRAAELLGWSAGRNLEECLATAWAWHLASDPAGPRVAS